MQLDLAILYWFYKEPDITKNHLELIRKHNPGRKIYGLFGGEPKEEELYQKTLDGLLDDFWTYPGTYSTTPYEKWIHGDLMILDWYDKRGRTLEWDSIAITQWDMLVFDDIANQFPGLGKGQVFLSGYRDLDEALENRWAWTRPDYEPREDYEKFLRLINEKYGYNKRPKACLYLFEILTREFFDKFLELDDKKTGMLEYKVPTLAYIFGQEIYQHDIGVYWRDNRNADDSPMIALKNLKVQKEYVLSQLSKPDGWRIFHPYHKKWS